MKENIEYWGGHPNKYGYRLCRKCNNVFRKYKLNLYNLIFLAI